MLADQTVQPAPSFTGQLFNIPQHRLDHLEPEFIQHKLIDGMKR